MVFSLNVYDQVRGLFLILKSKLSWIYLPSFNLKHKKGWDPKHEPFNSFTFKIFSFFLKNKLACN